MDRIQAMRVFVRVVEAGSFSKAAIGLNVPRAAVSTGVQELEAYLGVRLLNRTTRRLSLTADGAATLERCRRLLDDMDELEGLFRPSEAPLTGRLKVDLPGRMARCVVVPALPDFFRLYPGIQLELGVTDRPIDLIQEGVDCVVRAGELRDSRLVSRRLGQMRQGSFASPDYLARHGMPTHPSDLARHRVVTYLSPASGKALPWEYMENGQVQVLSPPGTVSVNNAESYVACALAGLGLIQVPANNLAEDVAAGRLVEVLIDWPPPPLPVSVLYPHRRNRSRKVLAFVEWLTGVLTKAGVAA